jgi:2-haloalkanoic acid dehalogenase type II
MSNTLEKNWPRAILLDFYGTVVEEIRIPVQKICERICSAVPAAVIKDSEVVAYWASIFMDLCSRSYGTSFELQKVLEQRSLQEAFDRFQINLDSHTLSCLLSEYRCCPTLFLESRKVLSLCQVPVCLVTNIDNYEISQAIENTGLHFDYVVTSEDCRAYKPRPEIFRRALSRLNLPAQAVLHVGDSLQSDIKGAQEMGIPVLWINRRKKPLSSNQVQPDYQSNNLSGLLEIIK